MHALTPTHYEINFSAKQHRCQVKCVAFTINSLSGIVVYAHRTASVAKFMTSCLCLLRDIMLLTIEWSVSAMGM